MFNRIRLAGASLIAALAGSKAAEAAPQTEEPITVATATEEEELMDPRNHPPVVQAPVRQRQRVAVTTGRPKYTNAQYHGGKHRNDCDRAIQAEYVDAAQAKRDRKNAKRAAEAARR